MFLLVVDGNEQLLAGVYAKLGVDVAHVVVEGARGDAQLVLDLRGGFTGDEQSQHVGLARGEPVALGGNLHDVAGGLILLASKLRCASRTVVGLRVLSVDLFGRTYVGRSDVELDSRTVFFVDI